VKFGKDIAMKSIIIYVLILFVPGSLFAYELGTFNLTSPTSLEKGQGEIKIRHRFYGEVDEEPLDTFLGMDIGANVGIGIRYQVLPKAEFNISRYRNQKELTFGVSYALIFSDVPIQSQIDVQYFRYKEFNFVTNSEENQNGVFGLLSLRTDPILNRFTTVVNLGYNSDNEEFGAGIGLAFMVLEYMGLLQRLSIVGEYYPITEESLEDRSFAFGIRVETYGHHFDFILHNNSEIGVKRLMAGTLPETNLRFGFNIKRRID
jgi:hypothetical protein